MTEKPCHAEKTKAVFPISNEFYRTIVGGYKNSKTKTDRDKVHMSSKYSNNNGRRTLQTGRCIEFTRK